MDRSIAWTRRLFDPIMCSFLLDLPNPSFQSAPNAKRESSWVLTIRKDSCYHTLHPDAPGFGRLMKRIKHSPSLFILILVCILSPGSLAGQEQEESPASSSSKNFTILPLVYYTPETRVAFGVGGVYTFRPGLSRKSTRPTSVWMFGVYTLNKQVRVMFKPEVYSLNNTYFFSATLMFEKFPQRFYGIGSETQKAAEEIYTPQTILFKIGLKRKVFGSLYGGVEYHLETTRMLSVEPAGALDEGNLIGSGGGRISGIGFNLSWDSRDNILFPRRGQFFQLSAHLYHEAFASRYNYTRFVVDLRNYFPLFDNHVLALQAYLGSSGGSPPFYKLSLLGGDWLMRGYYLGRYRDTGILALQAEYRLPLWKRIGIVGFAGLGDVFERIGEFRLDRLKYSIGGGIRFKLDAREGTNLRVDFAFGKKSFGVYFTAREAF